jgi:hypothetical protein
MQHLDTHQPRPRFWIVGFAGPELAPLHRPVHGYAEAAALVRGWAEALEPGRPVLALLVDERMQEMARIDRLGTVRLPLAPAEAEAAGRAHARRWAA